MSELSKLSLRKKDSIDVLGKKFEPKELAIIAAVSGIVLGVVGALTYTRLKPRFDRRRHQRELEARLKRVQRLVADGKMDAKSVEKVMREIEALQAVVREYETAD